MRQDIIDQRNQYAVYNDSAILTITRRNGDKYDILLDAADVPKAQRHCWHMANARNTYYAGAKHRIYFHRYLTDTPPKKACIFVNHNVLDCRRSNLLIGTKRDGSLLHRKAGKTGERNIHS